jgi:hypothetical protein
MTSVPAPQPMIELRSSPAGTFLKKSLSHSLVFAKNSEPSLTSQQRKVTAKIYNAKPLRCPTPSGGPSKTKKKKTVRRAHSFDDSNHGPNSSLRASNKKEFMKAHSLPDSKANVTFNLQNAIYEIERIRDTPSITDSDIWWTARDYLEIKQEYEAVIYLLEQNLPVNELEHSARGLEKRTERGAWTLFEHQRNARNAVLRQQDKQRKLKYVDVTAIAQAYIQENGDLVQQAIQVAAVDAKVACDFLHSNDACMEEKSRTFELKKDPSCGILTSTEVLSPLRTPISTKKPAVSPSKILSPQSPTCWHDSIGFLGCHKAGRSKAAIRDSIVNSYLAAWQQPLINNEFPKNSIASKKSNKSYVSDDNYLVMSDDDSDFNDATEIDSLSHIYTVEEFDSKEDATAPYVRDLASMHVRFAKRVQKIKRVKVKDVEKDTERRWYSKSELIAIAHVVNNVIQMMEKETQLAENDLVMEEKYNETRRGLEKSTETGAWKLFDRRRDAINAVLVLQSQQRRDNMMNPSALAEAYKAATKEACQEAIKFGKQDAKEAKKYRLKRRSVCDNGSSSKNLAQFRVSDDLRSTLTELSDVSSSPPPQPYDATEDADMCDLSVRSLLDLNEVSTSTPEYNVDNINRISCSRRRLSGSHPPSRRFVLATTAIFDRTQKSVENKTINISSKKCKSKDRNVVISWRRNSSSSMTTENCITASNTNLLTAMDASIIDDFDIIVHEFIEESSGGRTSLTAEGIVNENDMSTKQACIEENLSIKIQPETVNRHEPDVSIDPLFGLLAQSTLPQRSKSAELIHSIESRNIYETKSVESTSDSKEIIQFAANDTLPVTAHSYCKCVEFSGKGRCNIGSPVRMGDSSCHLLCNEDAPITCSNKENQLLGGNIDVAMRTKSNLDSSAPIWFKVHPSDVRMIKLQDGDVAYLLKNPEKHRVPPPYLTDIC